MGAAGFSGASMVAAHMAISNSMRRSSYGGGSTGDKKNMEEQHANEFKEATKRAYAELQIERNAALQKRRAIAAIVNGRILLLRPIGVQDLNFPRSTPLTAKFKTGKLTTSVTRNG